MVASLVHCTARASVRTAEFSELKANEMRAVTVVYMQIRPSRTAAQNLVRCIKFCLLANLTGKIDPPPEPGPPFPY